METWQMILVLVVIAIVGLVSEYHQIRKKRKKLKLVQEFLGNFDEWCSSQWNDKQLYNWMISKSEIIQKQLGYSGLIDLRLPFEKGYHKNYPIILNSIPAIQRGISDLYLNKEEVATYCQMVDGCLRRFIGSREEYISYRLKKLYNPLSLFCNGIGVILAIPVYMLEECKIISPNRSELITESNFFGFINLIASLVTIVSGSMVIVLGWDKFVQIIGF
ncbi:MAG: hypothetical protein ACIAQZ_04755 [Sedimentisphaeraceae bacterium JB056]